MARSREFVRQGVLGVEALRRWAIKGVFERIFAALSEDPDFEYALVDGTIVKVHRHGAGAKGGLKIRPSAGRAAG
jgi:transposase